MGGHFDLMTSNDGCTETFKRAGCCWNVKISSHPVSLCLMCSGQVRNPGIHFIWVNNNNNLYIVLIITLQQFTFWKIYLNSKQWNLELTGGNWFMHSPPVDETAMLCLQDYPNNQQNGSNLFSVPTHTWKPEHFILQRETTSLVPSTIWNHPQTIISSL